MAWARRGALAARCGPLLIAAALSGCGGTAGPTTNGDPVVAVGAATTGAGPGVHQIDGMNMRIQCRGLGGPTAILESGLGVASDAAWRQVVTRVARSQRVCWYDRAGTGLSDQRPDPRTSARMVSELEALLAAADVQPPYVLVGAAFGGLNAQLFAKQHPDDVVGLVLVDSLTPDFDARYAGLVGAAAAVTRANQIEANAEGVRFADQQASDHQVATAGALPAVPLLVLVHGVSFDAGVRPARRVEALWRAEQRRLAAASGRGRVEIVPGTHHDIATERPAVVAAAIRKVSAGG
jgi:pimeloyl-ACP methyl ester carboxylesterase